MRSGSVQLRCLATQSTATNHLSETRKAFSMYSTAINSFNIWPSSTSGTSSFTLQQWNLTRLKPYTTRPKKLWRVESEDGKPLCQAFKLVNTFFWWCCVLQFVVFFCDISLVDVNTKCSNAWVTPFLKEDCKICFWDLLSQLESWLQSECAQAKPNMEILQEQQVWRQAPWPKLKKKKLHLG